jgi:hypothetical protein
MPRTLTRLDGQTIGTYVVLGLADPDTQGLPLWRCRCTDCGTEEGLRHQRLLRALERGSGPRCRVCQPPQPTRTGTGSTPRADMHTWRSPDGTWHYVDEAPPAKSRARRVFIRHAPCGAVVDRNAQQLRTGSIPRCATCEPSSAYNSIHGRLRTERGRAAEHRCWVLGCERMADDWGLVAGHLLNAAGSVAETPDRPGGRPMPYAAHTALYAPLCRSHHIAADSHGVRLTLAPPIGAAFIHETALAVADGSAHKTRAGAKPAPEYLEVPNA